MPHNPALLDREVRLAIANLTYMADWTIYEGAGLRMLQLPDDSHFGESRHPDDLPPVDEFEIGQCVEKLERYVHTQQWSPSLPIEIGHLGKIVEWIFSPGVVKEYESEKADGEWERVPAPHDEGAADVPLGYFYNGLISELLEQARARLKVDQDEPLTMGDIALLTGKRDATITTTAYRKVFPTFEHDNKRYATVSDVLPWLLENGFLPTKNNEARKPSLAKTKAVDEYLFVPAARDGSLFDPSCAVGGRYTIGAKGSEVKFDDYFKALTELQRMPTPRWRRPGPAGVPGIVAGVRFVRIARSRIKPD